MKTKREAAKEKIILATISFIEREGIESLTVRKIAKNADVNVAAINYYFGNKENLLSETFRITISHFFDDLETILKHRELHAYSLLKVFLLFILKGSIRYPNFMKVILYNEKYSKLFGTSYVEGIKSFIDRLKEMLSEGETLSGRAQLEKNNFQNAIMQMFFAVLTPGLLLSFSRSIFNIELSKHESQVAYVDILIKNNLPWLMEKSEKIDYILRELMDTD